MQELKVLMILTCKSCLADSAAHLEEKVTKPTGCGPEACKERERVMKRAFVIISKQIYKHNHLVSCLIRHFLCLVNT